MKPVAKFAKIKSETKTMIKIALIVSLGTPDFWLIKLILVIISQWINIAQIKKKSRASLTFVNEALLSLAVAVLLATAHSNEIPA